MIGEKGVGSGNQLGMLGEKFSKVALHTNYRKFRKLRTILFAKPISSGSTESHHHLSHDLNPKPPPRKFSFPVSY